jgi:hypothetical protein
MGEVKYVLISLLQIAHMLFIVPYLLR